LSFMFYVLRGAAFIAVRAVASLLFRGSVFVLRCASVLSVKFYVLGEEAIHALGQSNELSAFLLLCIHDYLAYAKAVWDENRIWDSPGEIGFRWVTRLVFGEYYTLLDMSKRFLQFLSGHFGVTENLRQKTTSNCLAFMNRHNCTSSIRMTHKPMTPLRTDFLKSMPFQGFDQS